jgi:hypothetical protein
MNTPYTLEEIKLWKITGDLPCPILDSDCSHNHRTFGRENPDQTSGIFRVTCFENDVNGFNAYIFTDPNEGTFMVKFCKLHQELEIMNCDRHLK